jgi:hypothetical protein
MFNLDDFRLVAAGIFLACSVLYFLGRIFSISLGKKCPHGYCGRRLTFRWTKTNDDIRYDEEGHPIKKESYYMYCWDCNDKIYLGEDWVRTTSGGGLAS